MPFVNLAPTQRNLTTAVFVDAGYLFAAGGVTLFGSFKKRQELALERPDVLVNQILDHAGDRIGQPLSLLRTYWYDGASDGVPTSELKAIAALPRFKIRLGRLSGGGQKGVDGLIILDLINLSLNRVLDVAILLSGDEDLRETVLFAQGLGVTVVVAGVPKATRSNQSDSLIREADFHLLLPKDVLAKHILETQTSLPIEVNSADVVKVEKVTVITETIEAVESVEVDEAALESLVVTVVSMPGFSIETVEGRLRLPIEFDRALIGRLINLTKTNPVDQAVLRRARAKCIEVAAQSKE